MRSLPVLLLTFSARFNSLNVKNPSWVGLSILYYFVGYYLYRIIIIKVHFICTFLFYFLLSFLTYADVYFAIDLHLANS